MDYGEMHIKSLGNFTSKLVDTMAKRVAQNPKNMPYVRVDGPYGRIAFNYKRYETLVLVGGGIGVTPLMAVLKELYQIGISDQKRAAGGGAPISPVVKRGFFMWTVPATDSWSWFFDDIMQALKISQRMASMGFPALRIEGFVTKHDAGIDNLQTFVKKNASNFKVNIGRPDVAATFARVTRSIGPGPKRIGVLTCGPQKLVDAAWDESIKQSNHEVTFDVHRELFDF
jgi:predicted ferric reductase